jgi:uncharacterized Zn finger protein
MEGNPANTRYPLVLRERFPTSCTTCSSELFQLEAWRERAAGGLTLRLRCPECGARTVRDLDAEEALRVDDALSQARLEMVAVYEAVVRDNLEVEAALLAKAFALDLVGPDDFAPRRA